MLSPSAPLVETCAVAGGFRPGTQPMCGASVFDTSGDGFSVQFRKTALRGTASTSANLVSSTRCDGREP